MAEGKATTIYELMQPVRCRCGGDVVVKIFENQWFIDYGDPAWKRLAYDNLKEMEIIPTELRTEFEHVIDWLKAKACARKAGIGTKLPWEPEWIIEALSDSTIYMAYYTVAEELKRLSPDPATLGIDFWDYVFLGEGDVSKVSQSTGLSVEDLTRIREEFTYFYPLDCRHSGRDLIPNHLTFMIFNHVGIFPRELWPKGIAVNGSVLMEGQKMSKSLNNIIPLVNAIDRFGADPLRLALMITAEPLKDADFSQELAKTIQDNLDRFYSLSIEIARRDASDDVEPNEVDGWMLSRLQSYVKEATEGMAELRVRKTIHAALYNLNLDMDWYMRRVGNTEKDKTREKTTRALKRRVLDAQVRMLAPFTPHLCEEIWEAMGCEDLVSFASWPKVNDGLFRPDLEEMESIVKASLEDVQNIIKVTGIKPKSITFYTATGWKWKAYLKALELAARNQLDVGTLIRNCFKDEDMKAMVREVPAFARSIVEDVKKSPAETVKLRLNMGTLNEVKLLQDASDFFASELGCEVTVASESDPWIKDPGKRAERAKPYRPAIYVE